jgi:NAD/NADP transhydrogenase alpha subunit
VAQTPDTVAALRKKGFNVVVQAGAGAAASFRDGDYASAGAAIVDAPAALGADVVLKVRPPAPLPVPVGSAAHEADLLAPGARYISFLHPAQAGPLLQQLAAKKVTAFAMDQVPRITRAQTFDALSSMSNIAGYRAVVEAANAFGRFFTGQITAAG